MAESQNLWGMLCFRAFSLDERYAWCIVSCPPSLRLEMWGVPATQLDPGVATQVCIGTSGQNVDTFVDKEIRYFDRTFYVSTVASSTTPLFL